MAREEKVYFWNLPTRGQFLFLLSTERAAESLPPARALSVAGRCSNGGVGGKRRNNAFCFCDSFFLNSFLSNHDELGFLNDL